MKKIIFIILISLSLSSFAQKYSSIIDIINKNQFPKAYSLLFDYQKKNPDFPNVYFQLGNISYIWAINSDPIKNISQTEYYIHNTKLFYQLCLSKLDNNQKDPKHNSQYYKTVKSLAQIKKLNYEIVKKYINDKLQKINNYDKNIHTICSNFNNALYSYNKSVNIFTKIIKKYPSLNDLYLEQKKIIMKLTNNLLVNYDSSVFYFNKYRLSITNFPILKYNQKIYPKPIKTYRLQGITRSNFLTDSIKTWNYKKWAQDIQNKLNTDINHFRETIINTNNILAKKEHQLNSTNTFSNTRHKFILNQKIIFEIEKYDYNSLISKLFLYRAAKINFLIQYKRIFNDTNNYSTPYQTRIYELYSLIKQKIILDSLLNNYKNSISFADYKRHKDFIDYNYQGYEGLKSFAIIQNISNNKYLSTSIKNILYFTYRDVYHIINFPQKISYKDKFIPLIVNKNSPISQTPNNYYTTDISTNKLGDKYITGYFKTQSGATAFIAKINNNQIIWLKNTTSPMRATKFGTIIKATNNGCLAIIHTIYNNKQYNQLIFLNSDGKQILNYKINNQLMPRNIKYNSLTDNILLTFHGNALNYFSNINDSLIIEKINIISKKTLWTKNLKLKGQIINIIKIDTNYHIIANYHTFIYNNNNFLNTKSNIIHITTDLNGNLISGSDIKSKFFCFAIYAKKINSNTIAIIGLTSKQNPYIQKSISNPYLIIINKNNKTIYENFNK
jgi:hypothetical protein